MKKRPSFYLYLIGCILCGVEILVSLFEIVYYNIYHTYYIP